MNKSNSSGYRLIQQRRDSDEERDYLDEFSSDTESFTSDDEQSQQDNDTETDEASVWTDDASSMHSFPYTRNPGLLISVPDNTPISFFELLLDEEFLNINICKINKCASKFLQSNKLSHVLRWTDIDISEFKVFLGLLLHMGTLHLPRMHDYWKKGDLYSLPCFSKNMSRDRFLQIWKCLFFSENPTEYKSQPVDKLYKIRPFINFFNNKMESIYIPEKELSLDESMVAWKGSFMFRQYIKTKRHKFGIKLYMLTEPDGTVLRIIVCSGKNDDELSGRNHSEKVVMKLMEGKLNIGHSIYMDNYYNSFDLACKLLLQKTYCTGTLRNSKKNNPVSIENAKLQPGEYICKYKDGIAVSKWKDQSKDILLISSEFKGDMLEHKNRRGQIKMKPRVVIAYNNNMCGIDRLDQMMSYYPLKRKTIQWHKRLGIHIIQMMLVNSYQLYRKILHKKCSFYDFRISVIQALLSCNSKILFSSPSPPPSSSSFHLPTLIPRNEQGKAKRKRCRICSIKKGKRKETRYECLRCSDRPGLCLSPCFELFHAKK